MPKRIYFTGEDQELTVDFFRWAISTMVGPGWRVLILLPGERPGSVGDLLAAALKRLGAVGVPHGLIREASQTLDVMEEERIDALVGIPVQVLALARQSKGRAAPGRVLLSADYVPDSIKKELHSVWGCEVYTHYGMTEMGFGGGMECEARQGYHLRETDLYVEIVDPETGNPVLDGEPGEVVFTTLTRRGMPLIRYRTGDVSRFLPDPVRAEQCSRPWNGSGTGWAHFVPWAEEGRLAWRTSMRRSFQLRRSWILAHPSFESRVWIDCGSKLR